MPFDLTGTYVDAGDERFSTNRLFTTRQREVLAVKFGGCMDPDYDRLPAWAEAHHIAWVKRDGGTTTIATGSCSAIPSPALPQPRIRDPG